MSELENNQQHPETGPTLEPTRLDDPALQRVHAQLLREKSEPREGFEPMPLVLVFLFAGLLFWAGIYIVNYSGEFNQFVYDETVRPSETVAEAEVVFDPFRAGERFYRRNCMVCHQADGQGVTGAFPPLANSEWVSGPEDRAIRILLHGLVGPIEVSGSTYSGVMPGFSTASDRDIAAVLTWIRTNDWGNDATEISEEQVASVRADHAGRTSAWTAEELSQ